MHYEKVYCKHIKCFSSVYFLTTQVETSIMFPFNISPMLFEEKYDGTPFLSHQQAPKPSSQSLETALSRWHYILEQITCCISVFGSLDAVSLFCSHSGNISVQSLAKTCHVECHALAGVTSCRIYGIWITGGHACDAQY